MAAEAKGRWPLTLVRRGERVGSEHPEYVWWQELPEGQSAQDLRDVGYEVVEVVPTFSEAAEGRGWRCDGCGYFTATEPADPCPRCSGAIWERTDV